MRQCRSNLPPEANRRSHPIGKSQMGLSYMGLNFFKEIAKMSLELLGLLLELLLELLLLLLLLLLYVFYHVNIGGREAPPL